MVGPSRSGPVAAFLLQGLYESRGIESILIGVEHRLDRREIGAVPAIINLKTADIKIRPPIRDQPLYIVGRGILVWQPVAGSAVVKSPRPWLDFTVKIIWFDFFNNVLWLIYEHFSGSVYFLVFVGVLFFYFNLKNYKFIIKFLI